MSQGRGLMRCWEFGEFRLDAENRRLCRGGEPVLIASQDFDVLVMLVEAAGQVVTTREMVGRVWKRILVTSDSTAQAISKLRGVLGDKDKGSRKYIETVPKHGYRFVAGVRRVGEELGEDVGWDPVRSAAELLPREREVREVVTSMESFRVTTIVAPPGFGKTSLAILVAAAVAKRYRDGIWMVSFDTALETAPAGVSASSVVQAVASALGEKTEHGTVASLVRLLGNKRLLLILDACETVLDACEPMISELVPLCSDVSILATSRQPLGVSGEKVRTLDALCLPAENEKDWAKLDRFLCVSLFMGTAATNGPPLVRDAATAGSVVAMCRLAEGVPLVIGLAASMTRQNSLGEITDGLRQDFKLGGSQENKLRRRIARSHDLLPGAAQELMRRLAVFAGGWTGESAEAVCGGSGVAASLQRLVESSLVARREPGGRYGMLDMIRAFALIKLRDSGEEEAVARRHCEYFREMGGRVGKEVMGTGTANVLRVLRTMEPESSNVTRAMDWSLRQCPVEGAALCAGLWPYWVVVGQLSENREGLRALMSKVAPSWPVDVRIGAWTGLGVLAYCQSDYAEGIEDCDEALKLSRQAGDRASMATNLIAGGAMRFHQLHEYARAMGDFAEGLRLATELGDPWLLPLATGNLAMHRALLLSRQRNVSPGEVAEILAHGLQGEELARKMGNPWLLALTLMNRAMALRYLEAGRSREAYEDLVREAFQIRYEIREKYGMIQGLYKLAAIACERGVKEQHVRAAILLGGLRNLMGGRDRIPIPKLNDADFSWTENACRKGLGEREYQHYRAMGMGMPLAEIAAFALGRTREQRVAG